MRLLRQFFSYPVLVFGFFALILFVPGSYGVFGAALVVLSIGVIAFERPRVFPCLDRWFAFFLALYPLSLVPSLAVKGGVWHYFDYPIRCFLFIPLILGLRSHVTVAARISFEKAVFLGASVGGLGAGLFSFKGLLFDHVERVGLPIVNPIAYGQIAAFLALISLASLFGFSSTWRRSLAAIGSLGAVYAVYASGSAGALLGLGVGLLFEVVVLLRGRLSKFQIYGLLGLCILSAVIVIPLASSKLGQVLSDAQAFSAGHGMGTSQGQRLILWGMSVREIAHSPLFGIGPGHFDAVMDRFCLSHVCTEAFRGFHGVHNQYLDSFMNAGVFGLLGLTVSFLGPLALFLERSLLWAEGAPVPATAGVAVVLAAMTSAVTQVLYGHNISVISYFFTITFLWFMATPSLDPVAPLSSAGDESMA
jgi:O-antigen ligase